MRVLVAPDSFGGTLTAPEAAAAIAAGWAMARPDDEVRTLALSDGGEGLLDALAPFGGTEHEVEVSDARGLPRLARLLQRDDGTVIVESAEANGLRWVPPTRRDPLLTTSWGVGQLLDAARALGARRILVGLGGSATVDGGAGALSGLGLRLRTVDGQGLKVGGGEVAGIARIEPGWVGDWDGIDVQLLCDVRTTLLDAASVYGPQKGADRAAVVALGAGLQRFAAVASSDLPLPGREGDPSALVDAPGTGAAGGLAFGLAAAFGARLGDGAATVARLVGLDDAIAEADVVVTGEGRLDATSASGKVVGHVVGRADAAGRRCLAVVGRVATGDRHPSALLARLDVEESARGGRPTSDPAAEVRAAAARLAARTDATA